MLPGPLCNTTTRHCCCLHQWRWHRETPSFFRNFKLGGGRGSGAKVWRTRAIIVYAPWGPEYPFPPSTRTDLPRQIRGCGRWHLSLAVAIFEPIFDSPSGGAPKKNPVESMRPSGPPSGPFHNVAPAFLLSRRGRENRFEVVILMNPYINLCRPIRCHSLPFLP